MSIPAPEFRELDFSIFHPLDHHLWERTYCTSYYGGAHTHLSYWWDLMGKDLVRKWTLCRLGQHRYRKWYRREDPEANVMTLAGETCSGCGKDKPDGG